MLQEQPMGIPLIVMEVLKPTQPQSWELGKAMEPALQFGQLSVQQCLRLCEKKGLKQHSWPQYQNKPLNSAATRLLTIQTFYNHQEQIPL